MNARPRPVRPIAFLLAIAVATALIVILVIRGAPVGTGQIAKGQPVPNIAGTTLDGQPFDLTAVRGKPVVINFWGPSCGPCREEMPLLATKVTLHAADGLVIVGVLTDDPVEPARQFTAQYGGTWPTVIDPGAAVKIAYRILGRPQSFFVDRSGILRSIQIGYLTDADFERQFALISGGG
ncbi:MAG: cytochrome c biosis protein CcmG, thiol:disulfide interchange protein DsbE [Chloroflexota bacterium]|nr:cytochrome c biosis protein CcmG, thiol:disulfide interchange protein DsbE [Chloroflexota bacterium]